ncbi:uncharacterized protein LOC122040242 [Zingiber officinale]|uniref:FAF domain-containing protein n=1 Tax=Zingiber officinale TaxID=94328 RepID=A0A8J5LLF4_ZINOF|nr:uncharacterized protein LOC122040242 [Zingiber officinale]KAG6530131.1 hypothetical protein ZIOFF_012353 [Zingiber officinale]
MAVAVMQTPFHLSWKFLQPAVRERIGDGENGRRPGQVDVWSGIHQPVAAPYVHPLVRRSSSSMSSESLQICTESLGSENGSDDFSDGGYGRVEVEGEEERKDIEFAEEKVEETEESPSTRRRRSELAAVNYQCSSVKRRSPPSLFPPPLSSISRRDGPCLHMVRTRRDGRLVVEAVPVPSRNYLHASRESGRLLLSIAGVTANYCDQNEEKKAAEKAEETEESPSTRRRRTELAAVNYQCSSVKRRSPPRLFPPPLSSISRRDGPCLHMVRTRRDGRLVVEAVPVPSRNYLHASRESGRLLLSIAGITANYRDQNEEKKAAEIANSDQEAEAEEAEEAELVEEEDEEEEEEVEVVDQGTMVEVKVSTQQQQQCTGASAAAKKILRLSLFINKFVGGTLENKTNTYPIQPESRPLRLTTTTAAAAAVATSSEPESTAGPAPGHAPQERSLLFTSKRRNREAMLSSMRRCRQLRRPLFFWEPCFIATTS